MRAPILAALVLAAACGDTAAPGFSTGPAITSVSASTSGSSTGADTTSTGPADDSAGSSASTSTSTGAATLDVGTVMDFGPVQPPGCKGKVDLLFVISRIGTMVTEQDAAPRQLPGLHRDDRAEARGLRRPHHDGQPGRRLAGLNVCEYQRTAARTNWPNCGPNAEGYDCETFPDMVTPCDEAARRRADLQRGRLRGEQAVRAARRQAATSSAASRTCRAPSSASPRSECPAKARADGRRDDRRAVPKLNGPGGCNEGFLRDEALLVVVFISDSTTTTRSPTPSSSTRRSSRPRGTRTPSSCSR